MKHGIYIYKFVEHALCFFLNFYHLFTINPPSEWNYRVSLCVKDTLSLVFATFEAYFVPS